MASVMDKIKAKTAELKNQQNNDTKLEFEVQYSSKIEYEEFGIVENEVKNRLIDCEKKAIHHANEMSKSVMELSRVFSEAQVLLANHHGGSFKKWFEELGFKKDFVYMCLKRNDLFLQLSDEKVFVIPEKAVKTISKIKDRIDIEEVKEIVNSEKPTEKAKEKENRLSGDPTTEIVEIEFTKNENKIKLIEDRIAKYSKIIKNLEEELKTLKS